MCHLCHGSGIVTDRDCGTYACDCMDDRRDSFPFTWLGSVDHFDADLKGGSFVADYCCQEGQYMLTIENGETVLWAPDGDEITEPCQYLARMIALFESVEDPTNPVNAGRFGLSICRQCGGFFVQGETIYSEGPICNGRHYQHRPFPVTQSARDGRAQEAV